MLPRITSNFAAASQLALSIISTLVLLFLPVLSSSSVGAAPPTLTVTPTWVSEFGTSGQDVGEGISAISWAVFTLQDLSAATWHLPLRAASATYSCASTVHPET